MGFDEAAMVAAQQFEFEPAEMDGKPIAVQLTYRYKFRLKAKAPPAAPAPATTPDGGAPPPAPVAPAQAGARAGGELLRHAARARHAAAASRASWSPCSATT